MIKVDVGPFEYQVRLVQGLIDHEGEACFGLCDNLTQCILISDRPPPSQRLRVLVHELMHAWWFHFGPEPIHEEAVVDLVGLAMTELVMELREDDHRWRQIFPSVSRLDLLPDRQLHAGSWRIKIYEPSGCP